jgi:chromosome segregation ATPase
MAETMGGDIGMQILQAVQGLGVRMERLEARMDSLGSRMEGLEARMSSLESRVEGLEARMDKVEAQVRDLCVRMDKVEAQVRGLCVRMDKMEAQVRDLSARMVEQEGWLERLVDEFFKSREELRGQDQNVRTEVTAGVRQAHARIDQTNGTVVLMASVLRRPTELGEELEKRLRELATH